MLKLDAVNLHLQQKQILHQISLELDQGDTLAIIGPSGCGKSSLLLCIAGIYHTSSGTIDLGSDHLSLILQNGGLFPWKKVQDNIQLSLINTALPKDQQMDLVKKMAQQLKISHLLPKYPLQLSGGEKQRVAVARSLVTSPDILLLDEPSSALDAMNKNHFQEFLLSLQKQYHLTFVIVTHNIEEAVFLGKKIAIMVDGKIIKTCDNPMFGLKERGKNYDFYQQVLQVQELLEHHGGHSNE
ncbi:MAG: ABC transporter ATP-binding protein [Cellulosilyticaceae bacterium]